MIISGLITICIAVFSFIMECAFGAFWLLIIGICVVIKVIDIIKGKPRPRLEDIPREQYELFGIEYPYDGPLEKDKSYKIVDLANNKEVLASFDNYELAREKLQYYRSKTNSTSLILHHKK